MQEAMKCFNLVFYTSLIDWGSDVVQESVGVIQVTGPGAAHTEDDDQEEDGGGGAHQDPDHEGDPLHLLHLHPVTGAAQLPTGAAILRRERCNE